MKKRKVFLWGDLCIDKNNIAGREISGPGGSAYFCAKILRKLGWKPIIIFPRGEDYDDNWLGKVAVYPEKPVEDKTLVYKNIYDDRGKRTLYAENRDRAYFIDPASLPDIYFERAEAAIVCPIDNNVTVDKIKNLKEKMGDKPIACLPQGFFRRHEADGRVFQAHWDEEEVMVPLFDLIFVSEEDAENMDETAQKWSMAGPIVAVTRAERGCSIYEKGEEHNFPAFNIEEIVDPVGAGDIFSAAFLYYYLMKRNARKAAVFANATAGLSLSYHAMDMDISIGKINKFLSNNNLKVPVGAYETVESNF